jgi:hypothetical protein
MNSARSFIPGCGVWGFNSVFGGDSDGMASCFSFFLRMGSLQVLFRVSGVVGLNVCTTSKGLHLFLFLFFCMNPALFILEGPFRTIPR